MQATLSRGRETSCKVKIEGKNFKALIDTGAQASIISQEVYRKIGTHWRITRPKVGLRAVDGRGLKILGITTVMLEVGGKLIPHKFYISKGMPFDVILGEDWLRANGAELRMAEPAVMIVMGATIPLLGSREEYLPVLASEDVVLPPRTVVTKMAEVEIKPNWERKVCQIEPTKDYSSTEEVELCEAVVIGANKVPIMLANTSTKTIKVKKGEKVGQMCPLSKGMHIRYAGHGRRSRERPEPLDLNEIVVPEKFRGMIERMVKANSDVVANSDKELGKTNTVTMTIDTGEHPPIKLRPYRTPLHKRKIVETAVKEMLDAGIITRSKSPWSFPVVIVEKKDKTHRFCVDFRKLNDITKPFAFPLPRIDDILALLGKSKCFTTLDLRSGYWQVPLNKRDQEKTAFTCHAGLFEFKIMPFGLCGAPSHFQQLMSIVLEGLEDHAMAYLDDILVFSKTPEEHFRHLQEVFNRLRNHNLKLKLKKCQFLQEGTKYLGFVIDKDGIKPDMDKVEVIRNMPEPKTVKQVRGFIGAIGYYRRFIPAFSRLATPLIALTKKYARFKWTEDCQKSFDAMKEQLTAVPLLNYPDLSKPMILYTDASDQCIGACLTQPCPNKDGPVPGIPEEIPIYFLSHRLSETQQRWPVIEKEAYAIMYATQKLNYYLEGAEFTIKTDHKPLQYMFKTEWANKKLERWALKLSSYNCKVEYLAGRDNTCADLLSRIPKQLELESANVAMDVDDRAYQVTVINSTKLANRPTLSEDSEVEFSGEDGDPADSVVDWQDDPEIKSLRRKVKAGKTQRYVIFENRLFFLSKKDGEVQTRLFIPERLREALVSQSHEKLGHMGIDKTHDLIAKDYYWPNLYKDVMNFVQRCPTCQVHNKRQEKAPLQETDIPNFPFAKVSMDISGPYGKTTRGNQYILSFVDWYSNWPEAFPLPNKKAETVAKVLLTEIFPRYGTPLQLVTDNGPENVNHIMRETLLELNIDHITTSPYHPESNAKVERFHRTLIDILSKLADTDLVNWDLCLSQALAAVRFSQNETTKYSPYFMLFGRDVILPIDKMLKPRRKYMGEDHHRVILEQQHRVFMQARTRMKRAQKKRNERVNRDRRNKEFSVGDAVYYKVHQREGKLGPHWEAYFRIIDQTGPVSFVIGDQMTGKTKRVHANDLKMAEEFYWEETVAPTVPKGRKKKRPVRKTTLVRPAEEVIEPEEDDDEIYVPTRRRSVESKRRSSIMSKQGESVMTTTAPLRQVAPGMPGSEGKGLPRSPRVRGKAFPEENSGHDDRIERDIDEEENSSEQDSENSDQDENSDTVTRSGLWTDETSIQPSEEELEDDIPLSQLVERVRANKKELKEQRRRNEAAGGTPLKARLRSATRLRQSETHHK